MALSMVFLAALVGACAAICAVLTGGVTIWGAIGFYVAAGWAAILALVASTTVARQLRKAESVIPSRAAEQPVIIVRQTPPRR